MPVEDISTKYVDHYIDVEEYAIVTDRFSCTAETCPLSYVSSEAMPFRIKIDGYIKSSCCHVLPS